MIDHKVEIKMPDLCAWCGAKQALTNRRIEWVIQKINITIFLDIPICHKCLPVVRIHSALMGTICGIVLSIATYCWLLSLVTPAPDAGNLSIYFLWAMSLLAGIVGWKLGKLLNDRKINILILNMFVKVPPKYIELSIPGICFFNAIDYEIMFKFHTYEFAREFQRLNPNLKFWQIPQVQKIDVAEILLLVGSLGGILIQSPILVKVLPIGLFGTLVALGAKKILSKHFNLSNNTSWAIYFVIAIPLICWLCWSLLF